MTRTRLTDLNEHLFDQLERLMNAEDSKELDKEVERARAVTVVADKIIKNAAVVLDAEKLKNDIDGPESLPRLLTAEPEKPTRKEIAS